MIIGILLAILQQWCGINVIFFYAPVIFQKTGIGINSSLFQTIIIGVVNLTFTIVAMRLIDKVGRKKLLLIGSAGMVITYILIGACFFFNFLHGIHVLILILMTIAFYATSLAPVVWVLISEIYPNRIRGEAMSIATFFLWVASFVLTLTFPILEEHVGESYTFWLYAAICLLGWLFIFRYVPETKGKSLEELEEELIHS
jgi:MFS family permease